MPIVDPHGKVKSTTTTAKTTKASSSSGSSSSKTSSSPTKTSTASPALTALSIANSPKPATTGLVATPSKTSSSTKTAPSSTTATLADLQKQLLNAQNELSSLNKAKASGYKGNDSVEAANYLSQQQVKPVKPPTSDAYKTSIQGLVDLATNSNKEYTNAQDAYQQSVNSLRSFRSDVADKTRGIYSDPVSARVMQGRDSALQQANAEKEAAYQAAVNEKQQGIGYAQTQQQLRQSALTSAAGFATPQQVAPGSTLFNPVSGEAVAGGLGGYADYQTAEQVMGLIKSYPDAGYVYNKGLSPQENLQRLQQKISGGGSSTYNKDTYGTATANNPYEASLFGANQAGYTGAQQEYQNLQQAYSGADQQARNLVAVMARTGVNDLGAKFGNKTINELRNQLGDAKYSEFLSALTETQNFYSGLLNSRAITPTDSTQIAVNTLSSDYTPAQINASLRQLDAAGKNALEQAGTKLNTYQSGLQQYGGGGGGGGWDAL